MAEEMAEYGTVKKFEEDIRILERKLKYYEEYRVSDLRILSWLAENIDSNKRSSVDEVKDMLRNQIAVSYLLIWPILEQRQFDGSMTQNKIKTAAKEISRYYEGELQTDLDSIIEDFFDRYKIINNEYNIHLKNLAPKEHNSKIVPILEKDNFFELSNEEKIHLLLYVIYRYRNNIFHGNKKIDKWTEYTVQINACLFGMMKIFDCMKRHDIVIKH